MNLECCHGSEKVSLDFVIRSYQKKCEIHHSIWSIELCVNLCDISFVDSNYSFLSQTGRYLKLEWPVRRNSSVKVDCPKKF